MTNYQTITPSELHGLQDRGENPRLIDVREPEELNLAKIDWAEIMPLSRFNEWSANLDPSEKIVFMCHHGIRSANVCNFLAAQGFANLWNLAGGIDRWAREVDPGVGSY